MTIKRTCLGFLLCTLMHNVACGGKNPQTVAERYQEWAKTLQAQAAQQDQQPRPMVTYSWCCSFVPQSLEVFFGTKTVQTIDEPSIEAFGQCQPFWQLMKRLESLCIRKTQINTIPQRAFEGLPQMLKTLDLRNNAIGVIEQGRS